MYFPFFLREGLITPRVQGQNHSYWGEKKEQSISAFLEDSQFLKNIGARYKETVLVELIEL